MLVWTGFTWWGVPCTEQSSLEALAKRGGDTLSGQGPWMARPSSQEQRLPKSSTASWQSPAESWYKEAWSGPKKGHSGKSVHDTCINTGRTAGTQGQAQSAVFMEETKVLAPVSLGRCGVLFLLSHCSQHRCPCRHPFYVAEGGKSHQETKDAKNQ